MNRIKDGSGAAVVLVTEEFRAQDTALSVHLISGSTPNVVVEYSNDGTNWVSATGVTPGYNGTNISALTAANSMGVWMVQSRFYRVRNTTGSAVVSVAIGQGWIK